MDLTFIPLEVLRRGASVRSQIMYLRGIAEAFDIGILVTITVRGSVVSGTIFPESRWIESEPKLCIETSVPPGTVMSSDVSVMSAGQMAEEHESIYLRDATIALPGGGFLDSEWYQVDVEAIDGLMLAARLPLGSESQPDQI